VVSRQPSSTALAIVLLLTLLGTLLAVTMAEIASAAAGAW
jgi:hypothetical protein